MGHAIAKTYRVAITKEKTMLDAGFFVEMVVSDCDSDVMKTVVIRQQADEIDITLVKIPGENKIGRAHV